MRETSSGQNLPIVIRVLVVNSIAAAATVTVIAPKVIILLLVKFRVRGGAFEEGESWGAFERNRRCRTKSPVQVEAEYVTTGGVDE